jgi:predicted kinase
MNVILLRGLPGSGKSTFCKKTWPDALICSADDFFGNPYKFDPALIGAAHAYCFRRFLHCLEDTQKRGLDGHDVTIVVDNTAISAIEIAPYALAAAAFDAKFKVITLHCNPDIAAARNIHGVPVAGVVKMATAMVMEKLPPWWIHEEIGADVKL